jgi:LPXTG-motif cell wall-anchored protein
VPAPAARWRGRHELRADLRSSVLLVHGLALAGLPAGLLWWALAPRADFRITDSGPTVIGNPSQELLVGDDVVFVLVVAGLGLLAGAAGWFLRRRRGVATVLALALGATAAAVMAWQLGEVLGVGPTAAQLAHVGGRVTTPLRLGSLPALAMAPFAAVLAYLVPVVVAREDGHGRVSDDEPATGSAPESRPVDAAVDADAGDRKLVAPPPGRPSLGRPSL